MNDKVALCLLDAQTCSCLQHIPGKNNSDNVTRHLTAALASACLAFFSRALQMSRSSRRFSSSRFSFWGGQDGSVRNWKSASGSKPCNTFIKHSEVTALCKKIPDRKHLTWVLLMWTQCLEAPKTYLWLWLSNEMSQWVSLTAIVLQSPSKKLRRGVRKVAADVWRNSRSAPPSLFWYSPTVIRVLPTIGTIHAHLY